jgi:hypothetical protein
MSSSLTPTILHQLVDPPQPEIPTPENTYKRVGATIFLKPYQLSSKAAARECAAKRSRKRCHTSHGGPWRGPRRGPRPARSRLIVPPGGGMTSRGEASYLAVTSRSMRIRVSLLGG